MRALDHLVMPFAGLDEARDWFTSLGFTVAPDARHPFGTGNACVFFADGLFIEPLAVLDREACAAADRDGNLFVRRDKAFRENHPAAFSGLALKSIDADTDRDALTEKGLGERSMVEFGRTLTLPDGATKELGFRLAFAMDFAPRAPNLFICQQKHESPDRSALTGHANGASGIAGIEFASTDPDAAYAYLASVLDAEGEETEDGAFRFDLPNGFVTLDEVGGEGVPSFSLNGLVIEIRDAAALRNRFEASGIEYDEEGGRLAVACPNGAGRLVFSGS